MNWSLSKSAEITEPVVVNMPSQAALLAALEARLEARQGFTVATLNLDHVVKLRRDPAFRAAYSRHNYIVADGNPIVWLARLAGQEIQLVPGSELIDPVSAIAARLDVPVAFIGSTEAALDRATTELVRRHPGLRVVAHISPPMGFDPSGPASDTILMELKASGARLCLLALGAPRQEIFALHAHTVLPQVGFLSIGAGLDFIAGTQKRAPTWMRTMAAEWLWRLATNPGRLGARYAACLAILPSLTSAALETRKGSRA